MMGEIIKWCVKIFVGVLVSVFGLKFGIRFCKARRWWRKNKSKDVILFMGPSKSGKTEFLCALQSKEYPAGKYPTGTQMTTNTFAYCNKTAMALDGAGESGNMENIAKQAIAAMEGRHAEHVLLILTVDMCEIDDSQSFMDENICPYLDMFVGICEDGKSKWKRTVDWVLDLNAKKLYEEGKWAYAVVGTHASCGGAKTMDALEHIYSALNEFKGKLRPMGAGRFELSQQQDRVKTLIWVTDILKAMHGEG